jgi:hypothetical protein
MTQADDCGGELGLTALDPIVLGLAEIEDTMSHDLHASETSEAGGRYL